MENKEMVDFLGSIDVLDKNNLKKMIVMFGEEDTCSFLAGVVDSLSNSSSLSNKDKKALLTKFNYFITLYFLLYSLAISLYLSYISFGEYVFNISFVNSLKEYLS